MKVRFAVTAVLAAALAIGAYGSAKAQMLNGTFGFVPIGTTSFAGGASLNLATSVTVPAFELVNTIPNTYLGNPNDFFGGLAPLSLGDTIALSTTTIANGGQVGMTFMSGADIYTFTPTTTVNLVGSSNANGLFTQFAELGTITSTKPGILPGVAELAGNFNQPGIGGAVNGSFTFSTPPQSTVPEPGSYTFMATSGLGGLLMLFRRKKA